MRDLCLQFSPFILLVLLLKSCCGMRPFSTADLIRLETLLGITTAALARLDRRTILRRFRLACPLVSHHSAVRFGLEIIRFLKFSISGPFKPVIICLVFQRYLWIVAAVEFGCMAPELRASFISLITELVKARLFLASVADVFCVEMLRS